MTGRAYREVQPGKFVSASAGAFVSTNEGRRRPRGGTRSTMVWDGTRYVELDGWRPIHGRTMDAEVPAGQRVVAAQVSTVEHVERAAPKSYDGINALSRLAQDLGDVGLLRAVQGTDADYLAAASLVRGAIDTYGPVYAVTELQRMAEAFAGTSDRLQLAGNLARAATLIDPAKLTGALAKARRRRR